MTPRCATPLLCLLCLALASACTATQRKAASFGACALGLTADVLIIVATQGQAPTGGELTFLGCDVAAEEITKSDPSTPPEPQPVKVDEEQTGGQ
jgi:hypothetical protein